MATDKGAEHLLGLDLIRGCAAVLIMLYHYTSHFFEHEVFGGFSNSFPIQISWGCMAVASFFLLSGFLMEKELEKGTQLTVLIRKRFLRLYPSFWVSMILTTIVLLLLYTPGVRSFRDFLLNLTMLPGLFHADPIDGAYWTLQYEFFFTVIILFLMLVERIAAKSIINYLLLLWAIYTLLFYFIYNRYNGNLVISCLFIISCAEYGAVFCLGVCLKRLIIHNGDGISLCSVILAILSSYLWLSRYRSVSYFWWTIGTSLMILYVSLNRDSILNKNNLFVRTIAWIASISYPLYLIHQYIGYSIMRKIMDFGIFNEIMLVFPISFVTTVAFLIHRFIEVPAAKWRQPNKGTRL